VKTTKFKIKKPQKSKKSAAKQKKKELTICLRVTAKVDKQQIPATVK
jgi:hypothetical protein